MAALKAQLVEKQTVQAENHRLKLQLDSMEAQCRLEQRKAGEDRSETPQQRFHTCTESLVDKTTGSPSCFGLVFKNSSKSMDF